ncbi:hypothetical protein [Pseudorhodoplanes sinuspersici]|uniref:Uncharacterized protein n=1 Tax=Pseudorhodoplanes sinuspersici TaxID=1235591 RepID=A0A1W6ZWY1_9HYPH|nr:hypothetical protein [Pseudorhodoplanes sinuspersici]ARQ01884.1 hypothetical protein CAK95_24390 [Pseudorhodoplanes sinuspersici]RKE73649.1 hypothetical protein DFP91_1543 [Pseudorhodoplanes sinuspersici]
MANAVKGEVQFEAEGVTYTIRFTVDAIVQLEEKTGRTFPVLAAEMSDPLKVSMSLLRLIFWAALQDRHPDLDVKRAGELIVPAGGMTSALALVGLALERAFPEGRSGGRPPKPGQKRTGPAS